MKNIFTFLTILALVFCMTPKICSAISHSGQILFYSGVADEVYANRGRNLNWYVVEDTIKFNYDKTRVSAVCFAYDENDEPVLSASDVFIFQIALNKERNKYLVIRRLRVYEEYLRNNKKFWYYVKKDTMIGALVKVMQKYIDFRELIPVDIKREENPFAMMDRERAINGGLR